MTQQPIHFSDNVLQFQVSNGSERVSKTDDLLHEFTKTVNVGARDDEGFHRFDHGAKLNTDRLRGYRGLSRPGVCENDRVRCSTWD